MRKECFSGADRVAPKRIRKPDANASIKRLKWLFLSLLVINLFGIFVFQDFRELTKDVSISHDYYAAIELDALQLEDSQWTYSEDTFNPASAKAFEDFRSNTIGPFLENANDFMEDNQIDRMTFQTLQSSETVTFDLARIGPGQLEALLEKSIAGFLNRKLTNQSISPKVAKKIENQQIIFFVTVRTIGRRPIDRTFLYTNGRYESHDTDGLQWLKGNQFRFTHRLDVAEITPVPNSAQQLKNAFSELVRQRTLSGDDHRAQHLALVGLKDREVAKLPVVGIEIPIPEALIGAATLASIYINLVLATLSSLGPRQIRHSTEPWFLIDIIEQSRSLWQRTYCFGVFIAVAFVHFLICASPIMLLALAWRFATGVLVYAVGVIGIFSILGSLGSCLSFLLFVQIVERFSIKRR